MACTNTETIGERGDGQHGEDKMPDYPGVEESVGGIGNPVCGD